MGSDWERVSADGGLLAAARARFTGSGDLLDHLWWVEHPGETTPGGVPDPLAVAALARRDLYRPGAVAGEPDRLEAVEAQSRRDRAAATRAVAEAEPLAASAPARRRPPRVVVAAALALLVGVVAGGVIEHLRSIPAAPAALAGFDRPARAADRPGDVLPTLVRSGTVRELRTYSSIGLVAYGVRAADGRICLLTVVLGTRASAACTPRDAFARDGVEWVGIASADPVDDAGTRPSEEIALLWAADGTLSVTPVATP